MRYSHGFWVISNQRVVFGHFVAKFFDFVYGAKITWIYPCIVEAIIHCLEHSVCSGHVVELLVVELTLDFKGNSVLVHFRRHPLFSKSILFINVLTVFDLNCIRSLKWHIWVDVRRIQTFDVMHTFYWPILFRFKSYIFRFLQYLMMNMSLSFCWNFVCTFFVLWIKFRWITHTKIRIIVIRISCFLF